ncbi:MAG TPA: tRNA pseudouridine(13) synthase TruD [Dongiaceae bacterium]|nr:tRNA pseudouridine(13) synthase TruD [Dongiaceae bacterium]
MTLPAYNFPDAPYAYGAPESRAEFKTVPQDFIVEEVLGFEPCGDGEHLFLLAQTDDQNTQFTLKLIARHFKVPPRQVSYSGLKDRRGLTSQWFSVHMPGSTQEADADVLQTQGIHLLRQSRHNKKLRIGTHKANRFHIRLRNCQNSDALKSRLDPIARQGVPNYFGPQRFGHSGRNVNDALGWVEKNELPHDRELRGRVLSTLRAWLFNGELAQRLTAGHWPSWQPGDPVQLDGSHSFFLPDAWDDTLQTRLEEGDVHPATWLFSADHPGHAPSSISEYLTKAGLNAETRALRLLPRNLQWEQQESDVLLRFNLPTGTYATSVLRELVILDDKSLPER